MAVISIFSGSFCHGGRVARQAAERLGYRFVEDEIYEAASRRRPLSVKNLKRALEGPPSVFYKFTREKEQCLAAVWEALAELMRQDRLVLHGFAGHLLPKAITHALKVCAVANFDFRVARAAESGLSEKAAQNRIRKDDQQRARWTQELFDKEPYDSELYDLVLPMHDRSLEEAVEAVCEYAQKPALVTRPESEQAAADFALAAQVNLALLDKGHVVKVSCEEGAALLVIDRYVLRLEALEQELQAIARAVSGVKAAKTKIGPHFRPANVYMPLDVELPAKVLLVDDERDFVETLSERLETRNIGSAVVYNGEEALSFLQDEEPEVMVLDLRMPGIDGIEVLRQVKRDYPGIEVIILTGHGSESEKALAEDLGAFAYLEKPADIDLLSQTMKAAYQKIRQSKDR